MDVFWSLSRYKDMKLVAEPQSGIPSETLGTSIKNDRVIELEQVDGLLKERVTK
jgi:hypothetical protein